MDDADALARDPEAMWRAIEQLHPASYAWARACSGEPADAQDVLQAAYEKIAAGRARFEGRSSMKTWLFGVIRHTASEVRRRRWLRLVTKARPDAIAPAMQEQHAMQGRTARVLITALAELPERQREVMHLVFYEDLTVEAAAQAMGVSVGSARVHYDRGKKRLAALLKEEEIDR